MQNPNFKPSKRYPAHMFATLHNPDVLICKDIVPPPPYATLIALFDPTGQHIRSEDYSQLAHHELQHIEYIESAVGAIPNFVVSAQDATFTDDILSAYQSMSGQLGEPLPDSKNYIFHSNGAYEDITPEHELGDDMRDATLYPLMIVVSGSGAVYIYEYGMVAIVPYGARITNAKMRRFD